MKRQREIARDNYCQLIEDTLTAEEEEHYTFNRKTEVREMVQEFKSYEIPLVDDMIF